MTAVLGEIARDVAELPEPYLRQLAPVLAEARRELQSDLKRWLGKIKDPSERFTPAKMAESLVQLDSALKVVGKRIPREMLGILGEQTDAAGALAIANLKKQVLAASKAFGGELRPLPIKSAALMASGRELLLGRHKTSVARYGQEGVADIQRQLAIGMARGETFAEMTNRLLRTVGAQPLCKGWPLDSAAAKIAKGNETRLRGKAARIVRTEGIHAYNALELQALRSMEREDPGWSKKWDAAVDRVCPICRGLDEDVVGIEQLFDGRYMHPPAHPNCRCGMHAWHVTWSGKPGVDQRGIDKRREEAAAKEAAEREEAIRRAGEEAKRKEEARLASEVARKEKERLASEARAKEQDPKSRPTPAEYAARFAGADRLTYQAALVAAEIDGQGPLDFARWARAHVEISKIDARQVGKKDLAAGAVARGEVARAIRAETGLSSQRKHVVLIQNDEPGRIGAAAFNSAYGEIVIDSKYMTYAKHDLELFEKNGQSLGFAQDHMMVMRFHILVHEELHNITPVTRLAYVRSGVMVEEVTTEVTARMVTRRALPREGLRRQSVEEFFSTPNPKRGMFYDKFIVPANDKLSAAAGVSKDAAYEALERACVRYKRRPPESFYDEVSAFEAFCQDVAAETGVPIHEVTKILSDVSVL